mgnify:CR=1 FL=1
MAETGLIVAERAMVASAAAVTFAFIGAFLFLLIAAVLHR